MGQIQMNAQELIHTARTLVAGDKGLLAMDESNPTCNKRFAKWGIPQTEEARCAYRELLVTTPGLGEEAVDEVADATVKCLLSLSPRPFRGSRFCQAGSPPSWPRPV